MTDIAIKRESIDGTITNFEVEVISTRNEIIVVLRITIKL
jgi:hypothetical protein